MIHFSNNNFFFLSQDSELSEQLEKISHIFFGNAWSTDIAKIPDEMMIRVQIEKGKNKAVFDFIGQYDHDKCGLIYWKDDNVSGFIPEKDIVQYQILSDKPNLKASI